MDDVTVQDLITHAFDQKPIEFQNAFNSIMLDKVSAAIDDKKLEVAQSMFNPEYNDDSENDEVEDEGDVEDQEQEEVPEEENDGEIT